MSLLRAERRRLFKRRMTRWMLVAAVLILGAVATGIFFSNHRPTAANRAAAEREADRQFQNLVEQFKEFQRQCELAAQGTTPAEKRFAEQCVGAQPPTREQTRTEWYMAPLFDFRTGFEPMIAVFAAVLALVAFVVGASFVGSEWTTGGLMNLLLWRPRRLQVFFTKLGTLVGGLLGVSVLLGAAWTATFWAIASLRGTTAKMTTGVWESLALTGARGLGLMVTMAVLGFCLASLGRHTAMALGVAIGVAVIGQIGLGIVLSLAAVPFPERWLLPTYAQAWMDKTVRLENVQSCDFSAGVCRPDTYVVTWQQAAALFGGVTLVLLVLAAAQMRRRDIT